MFPESKYFRTPRDYRKALRRAFESHDGLFCTLMCVMMPAGVVLVVCAEYLYRSMPDVFGSTWAHISLISVAFLVMALVLIFLPYAIVTCVHRKRIRRSLRQQLREQGMPICPDCAYDMIGNAGGTCPECGATCNPIDPAIEGEGPTLAKLKEQEDLENSDMPQSPAGRQSSRWILVLDLILGLCAMGACVYGLIRFADSSGALLLVYVLTLCVMVFRWVKLLRDFLARRPDDKPDRH